MKHLRSDFLGDWNKSVLTKRSIKCFIGMVMAQTNWHSISKFARRIALKQYAFAIDFLDERFTFYVKYSCFFFVFFNLLKKTRKSAEIVDRAKMIMAIAALNECANEKKYKTNKTESQQQVSKHRLNVWITMDLCCTESFVAWSVGEYFHVDSWHLHVV